MDQTRAPKALVDLAVCKWRFQWECPTSEFSPLRMRADLDNFWWTWEPTRRTFKKKSWCFFFWQKKMPEFTTEIYFREFGFLPKKIELFRSHLSEN